VSSISNSALGPQVDDRALAGTRVMDHVGQFGHDAMCSAWLWALLPRLVSAVFTIKEKPIDTRR
jgi:hypothetical protein